MMRHNYNTAVFLLLAISVSGEELFRKNRIAEYMQQDSGQPGGDGDGGDGGFYGNNNNGDNFDDPGDGGDLSNLGGFDADGTGGGNNGGFGDFGEPSSGGNPFGGMDQTDDFMSAMGESYYAKGLKNSCHQHRFYDLILFLRWYC